MSWSFWKKYCFFSSQRFITNTKSVSLLRLCVAAGRKAELLFNKLYFSTCINNYKACPGTELPSVPSSSICCRLQVFLQRAGQTWAGDPPQLLANDGRERGGRSWLPPHFSLFPPATFQPSQSVFYCLTTSSLASVLLRDEPINL